MSMLVTLEARRLLRVRRAPAFRVQQCGLHVRVSGKPSSSLIEILMFYSMMDEVESLISGFLLVVSPRNRSMDKQVR